MSAPDLHSHDDLLITLSGLNHHDKISGTASSGKNKYKWNRNPAGLLQGATRAIYNATQTVSSLSGWAWGKASALVSQQAVPETPKADESDTLASADLCAKGIKKEIKSLKSKLDGVKENIKNNKVDDWSKTLDSYSR